MGPDPAPHPLERLLAARGWVLADGAMATSLYERGLTPGEPPERWVETHPERIRALHGAAIEAGAEVILTNSFGANAVRLAAWGAAGRAEALNRAAAEIAREAAGRAAIVAGSIGPTGGRVEAETVAIFEAQARALMAGGADLVWLETFGDAAEFQAAAEGAARAGAPWCGTMSFEAVGLSRGGRSRGGLSPADLVALVAGLPTCADGFRGELRGRAGGDDRHDRGVTGRGRAGAADRQGQRGAAARRGGPVRLRRDAGRDGGLCCRGPARRARGSSAAAAA